MKASTKKSATKAPKKAPTKVKAVADTIEEEAPKKVVVPAKYKQLYKQRGSAKHCGDWLAKLLDNTFMGEQGFDIDAYIKFLEANEVNVKPKTLAMVTEQRHGWKGRFRMNSGISLRVRIATVGYVMVGTTKVKAPREWLDAALNRFTSVEVEWTNKTNPHAKGA